LVYFLLCKSLIDFECIAFDAHSFINVYIYSSDSS